MISKRNNLTMRDIVDSSDDIDTVYETCDAEFNSRYDFHQSFQQSKDEASWVQYYLIHEIQKICTRDEIDLSSAARKIIADRVAYDWYLSRREGWYLARAPKEYVNETQ
jgi:hypothetical protein